MRKLKALAATLALMLVAAAPAFAQDDYDYRTDYPVENQYPKGNVFINNWG